MPATETAETKTEQATSALVALARHADATSTILGVEVNCNYGVWTIAGQRSTSVLARAVKYLLAETSKAA